MNKARSECRNDEQEMHEELKERKTDRTDSVSECKLCVYSGMHHVCMYEA